MHKSNAKNKSTGGQNTSYFKIRLVEANDLLKTSIIFSFVFLLVLVILEGFSQLDFYSLLSKGVLLNNIFDAIGVLYLAGESGLFLSVFMTSINLYKSWYWQKRLKASGQCFKGGKYELKER